MDTNSMFGVKVGPPPSPSRSTSRSWGWYFALGLGLIAAGVVALATPSLTTLASVLGFGWLVLIAGAVETMAAIRTRHAPGFAPRMGTGVLALVAGGLMVLRPGASAAALTMMLAGFFLLGGLLRIGTALSARLPGWGWSTLGGTISALLGILIWAQWPLSGLWVIGLFVAIEIINRGWAWLRFALAEREHPSLRISQAA